MIHPKPEQEFLRSFLECFSHRVQREQQRRRQADGRRGHFPADVEIEDADDAVKDDVDKMIADGIEATDGKVPSERQDRQRPVRFVALLPIHRSAPEVVPEKIPDWNVRPEVLVVPDCGDVIKNKLSGQRIPVECHAGEEQTRLDQSGTLFQKRRQ